MNPLNSKHYPKIMYLSLIVVTLLLMFNFVNILESANDNLKHKSITGLAIENNETNQTINSTNKITKEPKLYSSKPYIIFYIFLIGIIISIIITFLVLKSTINKNIELEENERRL